MGNPIATRAFSLLTGILLLSLCLAASGTPEPAGRDSGTTGKDGKTPGSANFRSASRRILYLGDSMSMGAFGRTLDQKMRDAGLEVYTFVTGGATPYYWLSDYQPISSTIGHWMRIPGAKPKRYATIKQVPKVEALIKSYDPDIVVVQTGTNMYASLRSKRRSEEENEKEVSYVYEKMCERVTEGGRRCYWITPPSAHEQRYPASLQERMRDLMTRTVSRYGRIFDSYRVTSYTDPFPQNDGIHYGPEEAGAWANCVAEDIIRYATEGEGVGRRAMAVLPEGEQPEEEHPSTAESGQSGATEDRGLPPPPSDEATHEAPGKDPVTLRIKLTAKSTIGDINEVTYRRAWAIDEYEVLSVDAGHYPYKKLRLAEFIVNNRRIVSAVQERALETVRSLEVVPLSNYPTLEQVETVDDLEADFSLPIFTPNLD